MPLVDSECGASCAHAAPQDGKHRFSWALTIPRVPLDDGGHTAVTYVGCDECMTAVATPDKNQYLVGEKGAAYIISMLDRMGVTARSWKGDPNAN